jgi:hypothetical protein
VWKQRWLHRAVNYNAAGSIISHKQITSSRVLAMNGVWNPTIGWINVLISLWLIVGCSGKGNIGEYVVLFNSFALYANCCVFNWPHLRSVCIVFVSIVKWAVFFAAASNHSRSDVN